MGKMPMILKMLCTLSAIGLPFIPGWEQLRPFAAELWLIATIVAVLLTPFFVRRSNVACAAVSLIGLVLAFVTILVIGMGKGVAGNWYGGMLVTDRFAMLWKLMLLLFTMGIVVMWFANSAAEMHEGDGPEFFSLLLGATLGMSFMVSTSNLLMILLSVELASLPSYVLAGFRKTNRIGAEASLKYVLFGAATSAVMAYGLSILYGLYGTLQVSELARAMMTGHNSPSLLVVALFGLIVGIGFKVSAVPFHFWCPDVFEGAGIDVAAFLSVASKGAGLLLLIRVLILIANTFGYHGQPGMPLSTLAAIIGVLGAVTATVGNTAAFVQNNVKRLLAYSSIAHAGYMLCAVSLLLRSKSPDAEFNPATAAAQAVLLYLVVYLFMNLGAFTVVGLVHRQTGADTLDAFKGLGRRNPLAAACMFCFMISLIGLPPFGGFVAKVNVLWALFLNGGWWWALIIAIGINTILSAFYYFRVIRAMYLESTDAPSFFGNPLGVALSTVCAIMLVVLFLGWGPLYRRTMDYSSMTLNERPSVASIEN